MKTEELKEAVKKIHDQTTKDNLGKAKKALSELAQIYSSSSNMVLPLAKEEVKRIFNNFTLEKKKQKNDC